MTILSNLVKGNGSNEIGAIQNDLTALKNDSVNLARYINENAGGITREGAAQVMAKAERGYHSVESHIKTNPGQSILLAFAAGLTASYLLSTRR